MEDNILFKEIINNTDEYIFILSEDKSGSFFNAKFKSLGYSESELNKINPNKLLHDKELEYLNKKILGTSNKKFKKQINLIRKDKSLEKLTLTGQLKITVDGPRLICRGQEITSNYIISDNIKLESYWKKVADNYPDYVAICDKNFDIKYINKLDYGNTSDLIGTNYLDFGNGIPTKFLKNLLEKAINGESNSIAYLIQTPDNEQEWFETSISPLIFDKKVHSILSITKNITKEKNIELKQKQTEDDFKNIVENASDIVYTCNKNHEITYINPVGIKIAQIPEKHILGTKFYEFVREDYAIALKAFYKHQFDNKNLTSYYEFPYVNNKGQEYWIGQNLQLRLEGNEIISIQALARDITERKKVEKQLLEAKTLAEESLNSKEHFLSVMSHEIRTPLNAVVGLSNLLLAQKHTDDQKEYLNGLKYSTDNLLSVINDVLDFSKIESKKIHLENIDFNLSNLLKRVQEVTRVAAIKKGLDVDLTIDTTLPKYVKGDPVRLNQVLTNLVSNAIKFTEKGVIEIIIYNKKESKNKVEIQFVVKDTGIGIDNERLKYIFEPFTQASSETTRKYGGSGLGLTISKNLIDLMKGKIKVDSKINQGSKFKVNITFDKTQKVEILNEENPSLSINSAPKNIKVLIVEDNEMNQFVLQKNFENWGIQFKEAINGVEALKIIKKNKFDLILVDLEMPKMDGYELSKEIRANEIDTPIIAISATSNPKSINRALSNGANDFLSKPVDNNLLISKISQYTSIDQIIESKDIKGSLDIKKSDSPSVINLDYLINSAAKDTVFIEKMINSFIINTPGYLKRLNEFLNNNELKELKTEAHKFKATLSIMGIKKGKKLIEDLELSIEKNEQTEKIPQYILEIENVSNQACKELAGILTKSID